MNCLIIGASSGLGRALAEELAHAKHQLFLVSSDAEDLRALRSDLSLRFGVPVHILAADLRTFELEQLKSEVHSALGSLDVLLLASGIVHEQDTAPMSDVALQELLTVNLCSVLRITNCFLPDLIQSQRGNVIGIGSVAAARARRKNLVYATSKAALEFYFQGLRHVLVDSSVKLQFYRVGYLDTQMTYGKSLLFPAMSPETAAKAIVRRLGTDTTGAYLPWWWRIVMAMYRSVPWFVYKRLNIS